MQGMQRRLQPRRCTFTAFTEEEEDAPSFSLPPSLLPSSHPRRLSEQLPHQRLLCVVVLVVVGGGGGGGLAGFLPLHPSIFNATRPGESACSCSRKGNALMLQLLQPNSFQLLSLPRSLPSLPLPRPSCGCECVCFCTLLSSLHSAAAAALSCCATTTYPYTTALARPLRKTSPSLPPFKSNFISVFHKV